MPKYIFQEYDCPESGIDFDLAGEEIVTKGQKFICRCCHKEYVAGVDAAMQTAVGFMAGKDIKLDFRDLPTDEVQKAAWIAEAIDDPY